MLLGRLSLGQGQPVLSADDRHTVCRSWFTKLKELIINEFMRSRDIHRDSDISTVIVMPNLGIVVIIGICHEMYMLKIM